MDHDSELSILNDNTLLEKIQALQQQCRQLTSAREYDAQRIHELTRQLETSNAAQAYLIQELEQENRGDSVEQIGTNNVLKQELEELRKKYHSLQEDFESLQYEHETQIKKTNNLVEELKKYKRKSEVRVENKEVDDLLDRMQALEIENINLLHKIDNYQSRDVENIFLLGAKEKEIEMLKNQIECLEENLKSKKEELEERNQLLETTQDQLSDANSKVALLSASATDNSSSKGNSLFAEVDDQRQVMKQLLQSQKKTFQEMKKAYTESEHEIRRLKRENMGMHAELQTCVKIFCGAEKLCLENAQARIRYLRNQNERLETHLKKTQEYLLKDADQRNVVWIDSMLSFCRQETEEMSSQLQAVRLQNAGLEEQLRNYQQESARWRFEALRLRNHLIGYENILTENKLSFKPFKTIDYSQKPSLDPLSSLTRNSSIMETTEGAVVSQKKEVPMGKESEAIKIDDIEKPNTGLAAVPTKDVQEKGFWTIDGIKSIQDVDDDQKINKENISEDKGKVADDRQIPKRRSSLHHRRLFATDAKTAAVLAEQNIQENQITPILRKYTPIVESTKRVQFCSPFPPKPKNTVDNNESVDMDLANDHENVEEKTINEPEVSAATNMQTKSNCIIRRMVVSKSAQEQTNLEK